MEAYSKKQDRIKRVELYITGKGLYHEKQWDSKLSGLKEWAMQKRDDEKNPQRSASCNGINLEGLLKGQRINKDLST